MLFFAKEVNEVKMKSQERSAELKDRLNIALKLRNTRAVDLCERTGIPKGAISYYLSGKSQPKADRLYKIAQALDVSEAWLLGFDVEMERTPTQKKNDQLVELIAKLRKDSEFFEVVSTLAGLPQEEYTSVKVLLSRLGDK